VGLRAGPVPVLGGALRRRESYLATSTNWRHSHSVAKPIEPTPTLVGEDAEALLRELENMCSEEEAERRLKKANEFWQKNVRQPGWRNTLDA
jgi:hypothetical protein